MKEILKTENIVKFYPPNLRAVNDITFCVTENETVCIYGCSGSGKTTLMRVICGAEPIDSGEIYFCGHPIHNMPQNRIASLRAEKISVIAKHAGLISELTVYENTLLPFSIHNTIDKECFKQAEDLLKILGIYNIRHSSAGQITPYQKSLTSIARAILTKPSLLLIDNFDYGLSEAEGEKAWECLQTFILHSDISTIFFSDEPIKRLPCNRTFKIHKGTLKEVSK